jgi:hypothetical protein
MRPVLYRPKRTDLALAFDNQTYRHGLHATRGKSAPHFIPEQRRNLIAHQPVEHAARLLRIDEILIHVPRMLERFLHGLFSDLVKGYAANLFLLFGRRTQLNCEMVCDRLALAVRVRRQKDLIGLGRRPLQLRDDFLLARRNNQRRLKCAAFQFNTNVVFRQVHDVAHRGQHLKALAQILLNRLRLGRGLDDHQ